MNGFQKLGLIIVIVLFTVYVKLAFFGSADIIEPDQTDKNVTGQVVEKTEKPEEVAPQKKQKEYVNVFFIAHNNKGEEVYRAVKREYEPYDGTSRLRVAVKALIAGPTPKEKKLGVYTEVPAGTRLISITESPSKAVINLSVDFENGGGTDGLYKRLYQLIKTAKHNSHLPIYLQLNGKQVDVIGGEGIMINQPLNEDFANE
ncbi:MAG: GerMN domain-containing protein [Candidatus Gastranaerophilaceae bacterium]